LRREEGRSVREIAMLLEVSRSSASLWVRDIELTPSQHAALVRRNPRFTNQRNGSIANRERSRARRLDYQRRGRELARCDNPFYLAGCMLWWAEGSKSRNAVRFTNSDPEMARLFVRFLSECFGVRRDAISIYCNLFADHEKRQHEIERYWLDQLELPGSSLRQSVLNRYSKYSKKKRTNKLPYGTCRVVVYSTEIVQTMYGSIQEFAGFERPEWLDC
jgi:hypothetical protein